jgi:putative membrane protein
MGTTDLAVRPARLRSLPAWLAGATVALQIAYPLVHGTVRDRLTVAIVVVLATACVAHAAASRGSTVAVAVFALTAGPGFAAEVLGVHTGVPFGSYSYGTTLGPRLVGVPVVIGLAWTMLAWPAAIAARRLVAGFAARVLVGGWALASADLFLDPQMVAAGQWTWHDRSPHLPGVAAVPLSNYACG